MKHLFSLNAEGGPLLCLDIDAAAGWRGVEDGSSDYQELCAELDADPHFSASMRSFGTQAGVVWEMNGAGTADIFLRPDGALVIVRAWLSEALLVAGKTTEELERLAEVNPNASTKIGELEIQTGWIALFWAPEAWSEVPHREVSGLFHALKSTSIDESAFVLKANHRRYSCLDERVQLKNSNGRRLVLVPLSS